MLVDRSPTVCPDATYAGCRENPSAMGWCVFSLLALFTVLLSAKASSFFDSTPLGMARSRIKRADNSPNASLPMRLVNGTTPLEGRVEVFYNDQWGTVCAQGANYYDARVICWHLGYADALALKKDSEFGEGTGPVWIKPSCYGDETSLLQCRVATGLAKACEKNFGHTKDLGVVCTEENDGLYTSVRLVNGPKPSEGRLEIRHNGEWGTVCDRDATFDIARVVCRQLGYLEPVAIKTGAYYGEGTGRVWIEPRDRCSRKRNWKKTLEDCQNLFNRGIPGWGKTDCNHSMDLGVVCSKVVPVRLVNGSNQAEGRIEVQHYGKWGTVCNYFRDLDVGTVVCRQLGYTKVAKMYDYPYFGQGSGPVWLQPRCSGNETSLGHCKFWRWGVYDWWCTHEHDAGVVCTNDTSPPEPEAAVATDAPRPVLPTLLVVGILCAVVSCVVVLVSCFLLWKTKEKPTKAILEGNKQEKGTEFAENIHPAAEGTVHAITDSDKAELITVENAED